MCGGHVSAATFVGFTGLVFASGFQAVWLLAAVGAGYLLLAVLVVAPLRNSRVYSLSDFAEWRLSSRKVRRLVSFCVVAVCWLYLLAQFKLVGEVVRVFTDWPQWSGWVALAAAGLAIVLAGPLGSSAGFQALQFWLKLAFLAVPAFVLVFIWLRQGAPVADPPTGERWESMVPADIGMFGLYSLFLALVLGVVGLPQFVARFYGAPNSQLVRDTVVMAMGLMALFAVFPLIFAVLARTYADPRTDQVQLVFFTVPEQVSPGALGTGLTVLLVAGAVSATIAVVTAMLATIGTYFSQCFLGGGPGAFRVGAVIGIAVPLFLTASGLVLAEVDLLTLVSAALHLSAATLAPMLLLGIWWRGLTAVGLAAGLLAGLAGGLVSAVCLLGGAWIPLGGENMLAYPAVVLVPLVFAVMIGVSLLTRRRVPESVADAMARMHLPKSRSSL